MQKYFVRLGRGNKINYNVVDYIVVSKGRYFVKDIYTGSFEISEKLFKDALRRFGKEILTRKENR